MRYNNIDEELDKRDCLLDKKESDKVKSKHKNQKKARRVRHILSDNLSKGLF